VHGSIARRRNDRVRILNAQPRKLLAEERFSYVYYLTITRYGDTSAIGGIKWFTVISISLSSLVGTPVQVRAHSPAGLTSIYPCADLFYLPRLGRLRAFVVCGRALDRRVVPLLAHRSELCVPIAILLDKRVQSSAWLDDLVDAHYLRSGSSRTVISLIMRLTFSAGRHVQ
jgi:hypothetical protein